MTSCLVTVYIPSHNYGKFVGSAIESVLKQSLSDWELLLIDDGSSDNTLEVLNLYKAHPKIRIFQTQGIGLPAVCNLAISNANGKYLIRLDGDDLFHEDILLVLANQLEQNPNAALAFPDYFLMDDFGDVYHHEQRERIFDGNHIADKPPNGAGTLMRTSILKDLGGYREDLGAQDGLDIWTRIENKFAVKNVNLPLFYYRRHDSNLTKNSYRITAARRQIKKDAIAKEYGDNHPITAIIPCRENFDFRTNLWDAKVGGSTLLERDIKVCLASDLIDHVIVACDNEAAKNTVNKFNDPRLSFFLRDLKSTIRSSNIVPTINAILEKVVQPSINGITVIRYIQTPFVTSGTLDESISSLILNEVDSSLGVRPIKSSLFKRTRNGLDSLNSHQRIATDLDEFYVDSQTFSATRNRCLQKGSVISASAVCFEVSEKESFFINSEEDLIIANSLVKNDT